MHVSVLVSRMGASPNARPKLELVIVLMLEAVTLFVSSSLFTLVATTLLVLITVYVGVLLLMSSMVTPVSGDLEKFPFD